MRFTEVGIVFERVEVVELTNGRLSPGCCARLFTVVDFCYCSF